MKDIILKNGMTATIREAHQSDAEELVKYLQQIAGQSDYLTFGPGEFHVTLSEQLSMIEKYRAGANQLFILAETGGVVAGTLVFTGGLRPRIRQTGELGVSVLRDFWGLGIATALVTALFEWAKEAGIIRKINLKVRTDHKQGIQLYRKLGFTIEGRVTREFVVDGCFYDAYIMGKAVD